MSISFSTAAFPILACASLGMLLLPLTGNAARVTRIVVGALDLIYAVVLAIGAVSASA